MHYRSMSYVRARLQHYRDAGKHVDGTVLLHIASVLDDYAAPVTADSGSGSHVHIAADYDIARDRCIGMDKRGLVNDRPVSLEFEDVACIHSKFARRAQVPSPSPGQRLRTSYKARISCQWFPVPVLP